MEQLQADMRALKIYLDQARLQMATISVLIQEHNDTLTESQAGAGKQKLRRHFALMK